MLYENFFIENVNSPHRDKLTLEYQPQKNFNDLVLVQEYQALA